VCQGMCGVSLNLGFAMPCTNLYRWSESLEIAKEVQQSVMVVAFSVLSCMQTSKCHPFLLYVSEIWRDVDSLCQASAFVSGIRVQATGLPPLINSACMHHGCRE
jgi:hypothetical protein